MLWALYRVGFLVDRLKGTDDIVLYRTVSGAGMQGHGSVRCPCIVVGVWLAFYDPSGTKCSPHISQAMGPSAITLMLARMMRGQ